MKLLNVSVGRVRTVLIGGEEIRTAHVKGPAPQPWVITEGGAAGDERAVHPDKLYAFARTAYAYWSDCLKVDPAAWGDGFFGENLTVDELDERDIRIGDEFTLGDEVRLVVTGARTPCIKLAWRLKQPRTFQGMFARSRHTGAYFGVLTPGIVRPGDQLQRVHHDPDMPSIADACDFVASRNPPPLAQLEKLLAFDKLSPAMRLLLGVKLDAAQRAADTVDGRWPGWREFIVERIVAEASDVRSLELRAADGQALCQPRAGQFVSVRMERPGAEPVTRTWSLSAFSYGMNSYRLTVRRQSGPGSNLIHEVSEGTRLMLRAPAGDFALDTGSFRPVVLVAAGMGITPLLAMLQAHLLRPEANPVHLFYGVRSPADIVFRSELEVLAAAHPGLHVTYVFSRCEVDGRAPQRITAQFLIDSLREVSVVLDGRRLSLPWYEADFYLCGPGNLCESIKADFVGRGANADRIFTERFVASAAEKPRLEEAEIRFQRSGVTQTWKADEDLSLLELAERAGLEVESDCRAGSCLTCKTKVVTGETTADMGDGSALLCIGQPRSRRIVLDC